MNQEEEGERIQPTMAEEEFKDFKPPIGLQSYDHTSLDNTNKILRDLERKLSILSSTSSQQTQSTSSVVHNPDYLGYGKQSIQSHVLQKLLNDDQGTRNEDDDKMERIYNNIFDPNELFQERNLKFMTTFGTHYNDDNLIRDKQQRGLKSNNNSNNNSSNKKLGRKNSLNINQSRLEKKSSSNFDHAKNKVPQEKETNQANDYNDYEGSKDQSDLNDKYVNPSYEDSYEGFFDTDPDTDSEEGDDDAEADADAEDEDEYLEDHTDEFEDDLTSDEEDIMMPLSPPNSPPRDLDPNKLYGLYNFTGPETSHCSLSRDEPVHLINDEDNYWWLIKKLTKQERMERLQSLGQNFVDEIYLDEEDGKIGFVPAECLETHGERLARLNCFKNEEMGKNEVHVYSRMEPKEKKLMDNNTGKGSKNTIVKSVTFENVANFEESDDDEEEHHQQHHHQQQQQQQQHQDEKSNVVEDEIDKDISGLNPYLAMSVYGDNDIRDNLDFYNVDTTEATQNQPELNEPETLSDIYPFESPLVIKKTSKSPNTISVQLPKLAPPSQSSPSFLSPRFKRPERPNSDLMSIGSYSPDTPTTPLRKLDIDEDNIVDNDASPDRNSSVQNLRRSVILDRLTKVTSDIQEQMNQNSDSEYEQQEQLEEDEKEENDDDDDDEEEGHNTDDDLGFSFESYNTDEIIEVNHSREGEMSRDHSDEDLSIQEIDKESFVKNTLHSDSNKDGEGETTEEFHDDGEERDNVKKEAKVVEIVEQKASDECKPFFVSTSPDQKEENCTACPIEYIDESKSTITSPYLNKSDFYTSPRSSNSSASKFEQLSMKQHVQSPLPSSPQTLLQTEKEEKEEKEEKKKRKMKSIQIEQSVLKNDAKI